MSNPHIMLGLCCYISNFVCVCVYGANNIFVLSFQKKKKKTQIYRSIAKNVK